MKDSKQLRVSAEGHKLLRVVAANENVTLYEALEIIARYYLAEMEVK